MLFDRSVKKIIVGLGNPGKKFECTRHNCGYDALDFLAEKRAVRVARNRFEGLCGRGEVGGVEVLLLKPLTYMNLSGRSVSAAMKFFRLNPSDVIVIFDDVAIPLGEIRVKRNGSAGGHNGIQNIIDCIGADFPRVKVGTGPHLHGDLADFVLSHMTSQQSAEIHERFADVVEAVELIISGKIEKAQEKFN